MSGLLCVSASSAGCWGLSLAAFFMGQSELHHSFLIGSLEIFFFLQMVLIWRYFKTPFKLLNLDIIVST